MEMQKSKKENRDGQEFIGTPTWKPAGKGVIVGQHNVHGRFGVVSANTMESVKLALTHAFMWDHKEGKALTSGTDAQWTSDTLPDLKSQAELRMLIQAVKSATAVVARLEAKEMDNTAGDVTHDATKHARLLKETRDVATKSSAAFVPPVPPPSADGSIAGVST